MTPELAFPSPNNNSNSRSRSIAQELKINHKTVLNHLRKVGFKKKLDVWVPKSMMDRVSICEALSKRSEIDTFFKRMVTGVEKWVTYNNIVRNNRGQSVVKQLKRLSNQN
ncbi:histone-lysine N-methyltransferase SETMAR [Trichonephila clavipes]|nr:histone-lysine N-methyltransferase SETMAR [Trichonephila clavipes]